MDVAFKGTIFSGATCGIVSPAVFQWKSIHNYVLPASLKFSESEQKEFFDFLTWHKIIIRSLIFKIWVIIFSKLEYPKEII